MNVESTNAFGTSPLRATLFFHDEEPAALRLCQHVVAYTDEDSPLAATLAALQRSGKLTWRQGTSAAARAPLDCPHDARRHDAPPAAFGYFRRPYLRTPTSLEDLAYEYGSDKSHDDHKYVDLYSALLDPIRWSVRNVTELGVAAGQSVKMWHTFFPTAHVYGWDNQVHPRLLSLSLGCNFSHVYRPASRVRAWDVSCSNTDVWGATPEWRRRASADSKPRVHIVEADAYRTPPEQLGYAKESMDLIIDDAIHSQPFMETALATFWPYLRPGGYYVVEDVDWDRKVYPPTKLGEAPRVPGILFTETAVRPETALILQSAHAFLVDPLLGHRNFSAMKAAFGPTQIQSRRLHASRLAVLRKRSESQPPRPYSNNFEGHGNPRSRAMPFFGR